MEYFEPFRYAIYYVYVVAVAEISLLVSTREMNQTSLMVTYTVVFCYWVRMVVRGLLLSCDLLHTYPSPASYRSLMGS